MKKFLFFAVFAALLLTIGCGDNPSPSDGSDQSGQNTTGSTEPGMHLGIIGFNTSLNIKDIGLLNESTESDYINYINKLDDEDGTALYYADYTALNMMHKYPYPKELEKVALVTFTDGLDNLSTDAYDPEHFGDNYYPDALHNMIVNNKIHGHSVEAYTIGLETKENIPEHLIPEFELTLQKLASSSNNKFQVSNMDEVKKHFKVIADTLSSTTKIVNLIVKLPQGYKEGELLRFTFDNPATAADSKRYIEATYRKTNNGRTLDSISYHGFASGKATIPSFSKEGVFYYFKFEDIKYDNNSIPNWNDEILRKILQLWRSTSGPSDLYTDSEFKPADGSKLDMHQASALIMLVLDCSTSLGNSFGTMQEAAKEFVRILIKGDTSYSDGGSGDDSYNDTYDTAYEDPDTAYEDPDTAYEDPDSSECASENLGKACTTDIECGNCMICVTGGKCVKGCTSDNDCGMQTGLHCNIKLARCLNIYASNKACSEVNCSSACCYAEKGLSGLKCSTNASPAICGLCPQGEIYSPEDSKCITAVCSSTTDNCPSLNIGASNPPAACYKCKAGDLVCQPTTSTSGCSASGYIINVAQCIPSGQQCIEGESECCSGMPCIEGFCY